jgi:ATP-dependent 26S proteasome regulatory subunit
MQNHDYTQGKPSASKDVKEVGPAFESERKKFATQMDAELLRRLRDYAKSEGRQIQSVLEEAVEMMLKEKQGYVMRPDVKAAHDHVLERYHNLFVELAK